MICPRCLVDTIISFEPRKEGFMGKAVYAVCGACGNTWYYSQYNDQEL